jgi:RNA polymerase sigma-70 factor (ECF subfamily)
MQPVDPTEERLRHALAADLDAGFAEVVRVHGDVVYSVALNLTRRPVDAEDLASEALLRAYRALRGFDGDRIAALSVRPWLLTILRNAARNAARDAARRPGPPPVFDPPEATADGAGPAQRAEQADTQRLLGAALAELPETQRTAVVLRHVVGLPTSEVAQVLGCPDGTAKSHVSRGLQRLRTLLTGPAAGEPEQRVAASGRRPL